MDTLTKQRQESFNYPSREAGVYFYYDTLCDREVYGIGKNLLKTSSFVSHKVTNEDTLDTLALTYYNNPTYWWIIANFNDIQDSFIRLSDYFDIIRIPQLSSIEFGDPR